MAKQFVLLQVGNMRGIDLSIFDFDYDLTWAAMFLNADGKVHGRFGGRTAASANAFLSLKGLRHALQEALTLHKKSAREKFAPAKAERVDDYPGIQRFGEKACIHCHNVYELRREARQKAGEWKKDEVWIYPEPGRLGLTLDADRGNRVTRIAPDSAAARAGIAAGDILESIERRPIASIADVMYALHRATKKNIAVTWKANGGTRSATLDLPDDWRQTDLSWRWSLKTLKPSAGLYGDDLTAAEKRRLGLDPKHLAFRQGVFLSQAARHAGIQSNDIILGIEGKVLHMTARQFDVYVRLNYRADDVVEVTIFRDRQRLNVKMKLTS